MPVPASCVIRQRLDFYSRHTIRKPDGCDDSEESIDMVAVDVRSGQTYCYLPIDDYCPEVSGCDWT